MYKNYLSDRSYENKTNVKKVEKVHSTIDYKQAFNYVDRRALEKLLSMYGIPDKYIKRTSAM